MKKVTPMLFASMIASVSGLLVLGYSVFRLGWMAHGASPLDFSFLHLDWVFQPGLPQWAAHLENLISALFGLVLLIAPPILFARYYRRRKSN